MRRSWPILLEANHIGFQPMRTRVDVDAALLRQAMNAAGLDTKSGVVEYGLRMLIRLSRQKRILGLAGKVRWEGDLTLSRRGRVGRTLTLPR
jgi:Arc/MetJ family transcription regulator